MNRLMNQLFVVALFALLIAGCDPDWPQSSTGCGVVGKLTLDGQAMSGVKVVFIPQQLKQNKEEMKIASGITNDMGEFALKVDRRDEKNILHGRYLVMVTKTIDGEELFHKSYNRETKLSVDVNSQEAIQRPTLELVSSGTL